jgi:organic radical activating enzyme
MMLTGGSPTMHPSIVNELTHFANERGILITIETEGSHYLETDFPIGLISLSPKFSNSVPVVGAITPAGAVTEMKRWLINITNSASTKMRYVKPLLTIQTTITNQYGMELRVG